MGAEGLLSATPAADAEVEVDAKECEALAAELRLQAQENERLPDPDERLELELELEQEQEDAELEAEDAALQRRTSIPPTFMYGAATKGGVAMGEAGEERRWRSFDCSQSAAAHSQSARTASSLALLTSRIRQESEQVLKRKARLGRRRELLRSMGAMFSSSKKDQVTLLQMQLIAEMAKSNRSLVVLNDMKTLVLTMEDLGEEQSEATTEASDVSEEATRSRHGSFAFTIDANNQKLLEGIENSDRVLSEDCLHHILELQAQYLLALIKLHGQKQLHVSRVHGAAPSVAMRQFLDEFVRVDGSRRVPCGLDAPTPELVRFEKLVNRHHLLKPELKKALDEVCLATMKSFTRSSSESRATDSAKCVFKDRDPRDVMQSLVREIMDAIATEASVGETYRPILHTFVEQMVFSRLACACYRGTSTDLDELNALWREHVAQARTLGLDEVGLAVEVPAVGDAAKQQELFAESMAAFNRIPHLVPSSVLAAFMQAVCTLYREAKEGLGLASGCISADVLLPLLVFVLSRCELPHLHSQVFLMEQYAIDESQDGSEAAYYLACLQAAMGYIMGKDASAATAEASQ